jgi:hypothetical protein
MAFTSASLLVRLLGELRRSRPPFMCELIGDNGFTLTVGLAGDIGCVQHGPSDGTPPYLMAVGSNPVEPNAGEVEFVVGGTATPIDRRYSVPFKTVEQITANFIETGQRSPIVSWEEI